MREGWKQHLLGEICTITKGTSPTMKTAPGPYPLIVTAAKLSTSSEYQFDGEAVCIPMVSSTGHGHASLKRVHYASGKFAVANIIAAVQVKETSAVSTKYLALYLQHYKDELIVTRMRGTANVSLSLAGLATIPAALPPLEEQQRIIDLIGTLDDAIEAADDAVGCTDQGYVELGRSLSDADFERRTIGEVVSKAKAGGTPSRKNASFYGGAISWLKSGEVIGSEIRATEETITQAAVDDSSAWIAPSDSTVVAMYGATAGQVGQLRSPMAMNQAVIALIPDRHIVTPEYLYHAVKSQSADLKAKARGAAQPNLSKEVVVRHPIVIPPLDRQPVVTAAFKSTEDTASLTRVYAASLRSLRSELLTVLLSGEHEIPESYDVDTAAQLEPAA